MAFVLLHSINFTFYSILICSRKILTLFDFYSPAIPEAPTTPEITAVTRETITVAWKEPKSDGGSHVFGYHLQMKDRNSILWQRVNKMVIRATHFKVTNINAGLIYEFKVAAENAAGISAFSKVSDAVLAIDACGEFHVKAYLQMPSKSDFTYLQLLLFNEISCLFLQSHQSTCISVTSPRTQLAYPGRGRTTMADPQSLATSLRRKTALMPGGPKPTSLTSQTPASL